MAQWIAHQTSNLGVAGSNPVECASFYNFEANGTHVDFQEPISSLTAGPLV